MMTMSSVLKIRLTMNDLLSFASLAVLLISLLLPFSSIYALIIACVFLAAGIGSAVHNAEVIAHRLGSSLGTLILALSVTVIEVALIVSLMGTGSSDAHTIARDTIFAAIMIVTNGILGICILLGSLRHKELGFQSVGTTSLLGVLAVLSLLTLILPNFTVSTPGPTYGPAQLIFVSVASVSLYGALVWAQTVSHKAYFKPLQEIKKNQEEGTAPSSQRTALSFFGLLCSLVAVVGLAKLLSPTIESVVTGLGAPKAVVGIAVALLVLAPETLAAIKAAKTNQLQTSLNLALGSGAASIALTIPAVSIYSIISGVPLALGLDAKSMALLVTTFITGCLTFGTGRTTALHGAVHLILLLAYLALAFMP